MGNRDIPDEDMVSFFMKMMSGHARVMSCERQDVQIFEVVTESDVKIVVFLSDLYTIGLADYFDIMASAKTVNCVVTASGYNGYTDDAKEQSRNDRRGLFKIGEFMGALHRHDYWNYERPERDNKESSVRPRSA